MFGTQFQLFSENVLFVMLPTKFLFLHMVYSSMLLLARCSPPHYLQYYALSLSPSIDRFFASPPIYTNDNK